MLRALGLLSIVVLALPATAIAQKRRATTSVVIAALQAEEELKLGERAYQRYCLGCHGEKGDGAGPAARWLRPKPRNFELGTFKFRTTPSGSLPTDQDLFRTITEGVYGTSMPGWSKVPEATRWALVRYIKTFSAVWEDENLVGSPLPIPPPPDDLNAQERIQMGRTTYQALRCGMCHGATGGGDGPASPTLADDAGNRIEPANFHRGVLRGGRQPHDIYRAILTGASGTPMPSFANMSEPQLWSLVGYIRFLIKQNGDPTPTDVVEVCRVWNNCKE